MEEEFSERVIHFRPGRIDVSPEDFLRVKEIFPFLKNIDESNDNFARLAFYLKEMASIKYESSSKYQLMYIIVSIGGILEDLFPNIELKSPSKTVGECRDGLVVREQSLEQQFALFQIARNCAADFSHVFYVNQTRELVENFSVLCRGNCNSSYWLELNTFGNKATDGKKLKTYFLEGGEIGRNRVNKLFCQMGYFLLKAKNLLDGEDFYGACMALVNAGNCGRNFNRSTLNKVKIGSITADLTNIRMLMTHAYAQEYDEEKFVANLKNADIFGCVSKLETEAKTIENPIDIEAYYAKREQFDKEDESPRAYDRSRFDLM